MTEHMLTEEAKPTGTAATRDVVSSPVGALVGISTDTTTTKGNPGATANDVMSQKYLELIKQSITGCLDVTCRPDGWRNNKVEFGLARIPDTARTMIGVKRLDNVQHCIEIVCKEGVEGDFAELGAWSGGCGIWAKACFNVYNSQVPDEDRYTRGIWLADTFACMGKNIVNNYMPVWRVMSRVMPFFWRFMSVKSKRAFLNRFLKAEFPAEDYDESTLDWIGSTTINWCPQITNPELSATRGSVDDVKEAFKRHGLLDDDVHFLQGWFSETLPVAPIKKLAILRLDGDFYQSTMDGLTNLYHKIVPGGFCIVDDYNAFDECKRAVTEFRAEHGIVEEIAEIDSEGVFWRVETIPATCIPKLASDESAE